MKLLFFLLCLNFAQARAPHEEMMEQLRSFEDTLEKEERPIVWDVVRVRMILEVGIEIPAITKLSVNPEVEFFFVKQ